MTRAGKIIGYAVGSALCWYFLGYQFLFVALFVGAVIVHQSLWEKQWYRDWRWERRRQRLLRKRGA